MVGGGPSEASNKGFERPQKVGWWSAAAVPTGWEILVTRKFLCYFSYCLSEEQSGRYMETGQV